MSGKQIKNYLDAIQAFPEEREALIIGQKRYTYGLLAEKAAEKRRKLEEKTGRYIQVIRESTIENQLIAFLAGSGTGAVPVIVPVDIEVTEEILKAEIPENACMAVMTSGTSGKNKLLFRTFESWYKYFPFQNRIFGMGENSRIFMQGSLAFTGNLNLYMAQLSAGGTIIGADFFDPRVWLEEIERERADTIYLIPAKMRALRQLYEKRQVKNGRIQTLISGSQSMGKKEAEAFKKVFTDGEVILYYGASELSYITFVRGCDMKSDNTLIGREFPKVQVRLEDGKFLVTTEYGVIGTEKETFIGDYGHMDEEGFFYFDGRKDDIYNINGRKVSAVRVENALLEIGGVSEAAVKTVTERDRDVLSAWVVMKPGKEKDEGRIRKELAERLPFYEIPRHFFFINALPKTDSGKIIKRKLEFKGF